VAADATGDPFPSPAISPACTDQAFHALDGWIGDWKADDVATGTDAGRTTISAELGGCVILERWNGLGGDGKPYDGFGVHRYDAEKKGWNQTWFGDKADASATEGKAMDGGVVYERRFETPDGQMIARQIIAPLPEGRFSNRGERSTDGGKTWEKTFSLTYTKIEPAQN